MAASLAEQMNTKLRGRPCLKVRCREIKEDRDVDLQLPHASTNILHMCINAHTDVYHHTHRQTLTKRTSILILLTVS